MRAMAPLFTPAERAELAKEFASREAAILIEIQRDIAALQRLLAGSTAQVATTRTEQPSTLSRPGGGDPRR
jgi:hypothetical protein